MKVNLVNWLRAYDGRLGNLVYYSLYNGRVCLARKDRYPTIGDNHHKMKAIFSHIKDLYHEASPDYREDLRRYATLQAREYRRYYGQKGKQPANAFALFNKCLWAWAKSANEEIDLSTITIAELIGMGSPVCRIMDCVASGYLRKVTNWEALSHLIG